MDFPKKNVCILLVAFNWIVFVPANAQFTQQGSKLVGTGAVGSARQSYRIGLSADGNTAIVGGPNDNSFLGTAWVFTRSGVVWSQQGSKLVGSGAGGNAQQGFSVSISADGNTAIVGGNIDNNNTGAAWVFTRSGGAWSQQGSKLIGTGGVGFTMQGMSVALSADGNTAIIGGAADNNNAGAVWVFTRSGSTWSQQGTKLVGTGAVGTGLQGTSVGLSSDGSTALVGGVGDNGEAGAAWVFTRSGSVWSQQGNKLVGAGAVGNAYQGNSVSLSADGNTAMVGGSRDNSFAGATWVYTRTGGLWSQQGSKLVGSGASGIAGQGNSVALSSDGNTSTVGGPLDSSFTGAAWVFTRTNGIWSQFGNKLVGTGAVGNAEQGWSVSLSGDGTTAMIGGPFDNSTAGAAWVFKRGVTSVKELADTRPADYRLEQNYPNPFNPSTSIKFKVPSSEFVTLKVFDTLGREVTTLVNEQLNRGSYETWFDAHGLASGVYFYRLSTSDFAQTRRLLLLR